MTPDAFKHYWDASYPAYPPVGYLLRHRYDRRWFRMHTLPDSRRYAESEEDYTEILRRHNTVLADVLGIGQPSVLILTGYSDTPVPVLSQEWMARQYPNSRPFLSVRMDDYDDYVTGYWHFFMDDLAWEPGATDTLLRQVADAVVANVLFVDVAQGRLYAPYDGGADVILPSVADRDAMRRHYPSWLSSHPLGL